MSTSHLTKLKRKATEFEQKKQFDKALSLYIQFVDEAGRDLDDADLQLFNRVGDLLSRQGNPTEALAYYEKAVDMYAERGFLNNAIALCNKILRQSPARTAVYYKLGKISASKGFRSDARRNFLEYADRMQKAGQREEALRALTEFADLCPDQDDIRLMLAEMLTRDSRSAEAIQQLEQLYARQEAEGRAAEARATADRIRAIDPDATPRGTGSFQAVKGNDLIFLDVGESGYQSVRGRTPANQTPVAQPAVVESVDVSGVAALAGLTITFLPDESEAPPAPVDARLTPLEGLEITADAGADATAVATVAGFDVPVEVEDDVPLLPHVEVDPVGLEGDDDVVPHVEGLATAAVTLTGTHPSLAPLLESPLMSGAEFGGLVLNPNDGERQVPSHDLGLASSLPRIDEGQETAGAMPLSPLAEETPDEWVQAALQAPRADAYLEHLLTPLDVPAIAAPSVDLDFLVVTPSEGVEADVAAMLDLSPFSADAAALSASDAPINLDPALFGGAGDEVTASAEPGDLLLPEPAWTDASLDGPPREALESPAVTYAPEFDIPSALAHEPFIRSQSPLPVPEEAPTLGDGLHVPEAAASTEPGPSSGAIRFEEVEAVRLDLALTPSDVEASEERDIDAAAPGEPEEVYAATSDAASAHAGEVEHVEHQASGMSLGEPDARGGILDTDSLRESLEEATAARDDAIMRAAFADERVELTLIDLENDAAQTRSPSFDTSSGELDALLAAPPSFEDESGGFDPEPLDLEPVADTPSTEEWTSPEVLIDGEWRDEHVGDLVSGEMFVIGERREVAQPQPRTPAFDDLAAAMLYTPDGRDAPGRPTPSAPNAFTIRSTPRRTLSFGGVEAQLRRRLELNPDDVALRRQLAEALLDLGEREDGLNELESLVTHFEGESKLEEAGEVVDIILRVVPLSVRHHQKRVEYAARSGNRAKLVEAYTELGDALFRCGEPDKARVVYTRVVELAPANERASFALGMLSTDTGAPRKSDEIPAIEAGVLGGGFPSLTMAMLTPEGVEEQRDPRAGGAAASSERDQLDIDVDAAFDGPAVKEVRRRTSELMAVESWAAEAEVPAAPPAQAEGGAYVDLGDWLRGEDSPRNTRMVAADVAPSGDEAADFAEMLRRFKAGLAEHVDADDFASHYDLGVAFKEMGLVDEAIGQFQRALRGETHRIRSYEALGQCFVETGQFPVAIALLQRAADQPGADEFSLLGVLYLLGYACEQVGRRNDAMRYFQRVFAVDIAFRDVAARLAALERTPQ
jgi:tetratricopeptide (TPR) repeat protein